MKSVRGIRLARRAPTIAPAEVPRIRSAPDKSMPFSVSPAIIPDSQASPTGPPPPRTNARSLLSLPLPLPMALTQIKRREARMRTATDIDFLSPIRSEGVKSTLGLPTLAVSCAVHGATAGLQSTGRAPSLPVPDRAGARRPRRESIARKAAIPFRMDCVLSRKPDTKNLLQEKT